MAVRIAIVGGGIAGALLGWRLTAGTDRVDVEVFAGGRPGATDATGASGGLVRGYETDPPACRLAAESLAELLASPMLQKWSDYREIGSVYLTGATADPTEALTMIEELLPGSAFAATGPELAVGWPLRALPAGTVGIVERRAGYLSPARLRAAVLARINAAGAVIHDIDIAGVTPEPAVRLADGTERQFDAVVVAAGAWSARLLATAGTDPGDLRTKRIQFNVHPFCPNGLGAFVDEISGLYGRPTPDGSLLIGLPSGEWDVDPATIRPDRALADRVAAVARDRLSVSIGDARINRTVASFDSYTDPPGLLLRPAVPGAALFSFTGGSGGAAKTVLAASRRAAHDLLQRCPVG